MNAPRDERSERPVGFIGLGLMGRVMAGRLLDAGTPLVVWNRSAAAADELAAAGAARARSPEDVFASCDRVLVMLRDEAAFEAVLLREPAAFARLVRGRTIVHLGTVSPAFSRRVADAVAAAGGAFVEAPVSGSRVPAAEGRLVAMVAGDPGAIEDVLPLLEPLCERIVACGAVPSALTTKLAANVLLLAVVTGLAEAFRFGARLGVSDAVLREVLDTGQMSSPISRVKTAKLVDRDFAPQAAISDVLMNADLILEAARAAGIGIPLTAVARELYAEAVAAGDGGIDMVGVIRAIAARDRRP